MLATSPERPMSGSHGRCLEELRQRLTIDGQQWTAYIALDSKRSLSDHDTCYIIVHIFNYVYISCSCDLLQSTAIIHMQCICVIVINFGE